MSNQPIAYQETNMREAFKRALASALPSELTKLVQARIKKGLGRIPRYKMWRVVRGNNKG